MQNLALVLLALLAIAWLIPSIQAYRSKKFRLSLLAFALTPAGIGVYWLLHKPDLGPAIYVVLMVANSALWRLANK